MIELKYSLVIEATEDPCFFCFYSPDLDGFTGTGCSVEDCLYRARTGMDEFLAYLLQEHLPIPKPSRNFSVVIKNSPARLNTRHRATSGRQAVKAL